MAYPIHASDPTATTVAVSLPNALATNGRRIRIHAIYGSFTNVGTSATTLTLTYTPLGGSAVLISREAVTASLTGSIKFEPLVALDLPEPQAGATARQYAITLSTNGTTPANALLTVLWSYI